MFIIADTRTGYMRRLSRRAFYDAVKPAPMVKNKLGEWTRADLPQKAHSLAKYPGRPVRKFKVNKPTVSSFKGVWRHASKLVEPNEQEIARLKELNERKPAVVQEWKKYIQDAINSYEIAAQKYKDLLYGGGFAEKIEKLGSAKIKLASADMCLKMLLATWKHLEEARKSMIKAGIKK